MDNARDSLKLLFVEDSIDDTDLALAMLRREDIDVEWQRVESEAALRDALHEAPVDLVLSDYTLPGFNGLAALRVCREMVPDMPVIFLSGTIGEEKAIEAIQCGATDYVLKDNMRRLGTSVLKAVAAARERSRSGRLEAERGRLSAIVEATSDAVLMVNPDDTVAYLNRGAIRLLGLPADAASVDARALHPDDQWSVIRQYFATCPPEDRLWQGDVFLIATDGEPIPVSLLVICHRDADMRIAYFSFIARDIRDRQSYEKQIQFLANHDVLTRLPNRTLLADRVEQAIQFCHWSNRSLAFLIIDIDRFKLVNDGYGQAVGDELLRKFANRLAECVRSRDTVARLGADCFAVLTTELASPDDVLQLASKLQSRLAMPFTPNGRALTLSTSIGISLYPRDAANYTQLVQCAEVALHQVKECGDGGVKFYSVEMARQAQERVRLEGELRKALQGDQLELHYQAQVNLFDESVVGFEALMRWRHPEDGLMAPGSFIPLAESTELIHPMGEWALVRACDQLKTWERRSPRLLRVAVNVSAKQFLREGFVDMVARVLELEKITPGKLELELTESMLVHDHHATAQILDDLGRLGVRIALDDFGTGFSNLSYLSRLPIHCLKIDKGFVQRALLDSNDAEIVRAVIMLASTLGLHVIAEGIEERAQLDLLRQHGCREGQGYYFARPLPADELDDFFS